MIAETQNRFMTSSLEETLKDYPLYSQDNRKRNAVCLMLFTIGNVRWYILEGEKIRMLSNPVPLVNIANMCQKIWHTLARVCQNVCQI